MTTDILIKTCDKDKEFLVYCLQSIRKFATGFRDIILVVDDSLQMSEVAKQFNCKLFVDPPPRHVEIEGYPFDGFTKIQSRGYQWQMAVKINWTKYTNAEAVFIPDSDYFFTAPFTPESFMYNRKYQWFYRTWMEAGAGIKWKSGLDTFLGEDTFYDYMCAPGFILTRWITNEFHKFLLKKHGLTIDKYVFRTDRGYFSEFVCMGAFIDQLSKKRNTGYVLRHIDQFENRNPYTFITQYWSWGGVKENIKKEIENVLVK